MFPLFVSRGWTIPMKTFTRICSVVVLCAAMAANKSGRAYTLWTEDAESGTANVLTNVVSYPLIQSQIVGQGSNAFHLANPSFLDNWFEVNQTLAIQPDTKLF